MSVVDELLARAEAHELFGHYVHVSSGATLPERWAGLRRNYRIKQQMVEAGHDSWMHGDPYEIADWVQLFTPIERALWSDLRAWSVPMWPQLPVGRFFVDFGNPVARVAIECDGRAFHQDKAKDEARDAELERMGWTVRRVEGWMCFGELPDPDSGMTRAEREEFIQTRTPIPLMRELQALFLSNKPQLLTS